MRVSIWTYCDSGDHAFRVLSEFSLSEMKCQVYLIRRADKVPADKEHLAEMKKFKIGGRYWVPVWMRNESDDRGPYLAVALRLEK